MSTPTPADRRRSARLASLTRRRNAELALLGSMSRRTLAAKVGVDQSHMARVLRGERGISFPLFKAMAEALQVPLDVLDIRLLAYLRTWPKRIKRTGNFSANP